MTFAQMATQVGDYCNLSSTEATTRIGKSINRHYRRITSELGLDVTRFVTRSVAMTVGVRTVTFTEIEKIDRIIDMTDGTAIRPLTEVSQHTQRTTQPGASYPSTWSLQNTDADSVTVLTDTIPDAAYSLQADGRVTLSDLTGSDEPVFPESYHDILSWYVISEELLKKEKDKLARIYESKADKLLSELRFFLADSPTLSVRPRDTASSSLVGSGGGGGTVAVAAGSDGQVQYNDGGVLAGAAFLTWNNATNVMTAFGGVVTSGISLITGPIYFPPSATADASPNALDDYEEGAWTPTIAGVGGSSGNVYAFQAGRYTKFGRVVVAEFSVTLSTLGTNTGGLAIVGFPFACLGDVDLTPPCMLRFAGLGTNWIEVHAVMATGVQYALLYGSQSATTTNVNALASADLTNNTLFRGAMVYHTT